MISLHAHSTHSTLDGYGTPEQIVQRIVDLGRSAVCITDHDNVFVHPYLQRCVDEIGIKPIYGVELRMSETVTERTKVRGDITILAKDYTGYVNMMRLVTAAWTDECFYYFPRIDYNMLRECSDGLIILSGCSRSLLSQAILSGDLRKAVSIAKWYKDVFGDRYYIEMMPHDMEETQILAPAFRAISKKLDIPIVLTNDEHYLEKKNLEIYRALRCMKIRKTIREIGESLSTLYYMDDDEMWRHAKNVLGDFFLDSELMDMFSNQEKIASDCSVRIPMIEDIKYESDMNIDSYLLLEQKTMEGLHSRGLDKSEYRDRLEKELSLIGKKGFSDYFLIVTDIVNWAKGNGILVGPSRGSVASSLVAYCLRITEVDPIEHGLLMERFLSEVRTDPPDIDVDFEDCRRKDVINYMREKLSSDKVAQLSTIVKFMGKNTLKEIGKVFEIPSQEIERVAGTLIYRSKADARASSTIEDTFNDFNVAKRISEEYPDILKAIPLEGQIRHTGVHAAGLVMSSSSLINSTAIMTRNGTNVAMLTGDSANILGALKIDILGLDYLTALNEMREGIGMTSEDLYRLSLDDEKSLYAFNNNCLGIFQFSSSSTSSIAKQLGVSTFDDVVLANALSRPGPLHSGQSEFITRAKRNNDAKIWDLGLINDITCDTYGYVVFQEQVIRIMREIGGLDWKDINDLRSAMAKSLGDEFFNSYRSLFVEGSGKKFGLTPEQANDIFDHTAHFGSWAFNKAHSVGYSVMSYWTSWFKSHHPRLFYETMCNHSSDEKLQSYLREYKEKSFGEILPPKINKSGIMWQVEGDDLRSGLTALLPEGASQEIFWAYPIEGWSDLDQKVSRRKVNSRVRDLIEQYKMFDYDAMIDPFGLYVFADRMGRVNRTHRIGDLGYSFEYRDVTIAGVLDRQINLKSITELEQTVKLKDWKQRFDRGAGDEWAILYIRDETGAVLNVHVKNYLYPQYKDMLWSKKIGSDIIVIRGGIPPNLSGAYLIAKEIWEWSDQKSPEARCYNCSLLNSPHCPPIGNRNADIVLVGMAPGQNEAEKGVPFVGKAGILLNGVLERVGLDRSNLYLTNTVLCRPISKDGRNRDPEPSEIVMCRDRLLKELKDVSPKVVVALGRVAFHNLTGESASISDSVGQKIVMDDYILVPSYHPAAALYDPNLIGSIENSLRIAADIVRE